MKTIGLIGGMSWESTQDYYRIINEEIKRRFGGLNSAKCILYSVNFAEIEQCQKAGEWEKAGQILAAAAQSLERAGADMVLICTNTMHKVAPQVQAAIHVPLLHIAQVTAQALQKDHVQKVALLGTRYTMEQDFYKQILLDKGFSVLIPAQEERALINDVIFGQLCLGQVLEESRQAFIRIIAALKEQGAQAVILGCTEIGMLINAQNSPLPVYDTTILHATGAVELALG